MVWAHSLGTGIATHALAGVFNETNQENVSGLVLESSYDNFYNVILDQGEKLSGTVKLFVDLVNLVEKVHNKLHSYDMEFQSAKWLTQVTSLCSPTSREILQHMS